MIETALNIKDLHFSYTESASRKIMRTQSFFNWGGLLSAVVEDTKKEVLSGVNLRLRQGETICIGGASGQGKSVFLRIIAGLAKPTSGYIHYFGEHLPIEQHTALEVAKRQVGLVFQNGALISNLKVRDNVALPLRYHGIGNEAEIQEKVNMALDLMRVRSEADLFPHMLSTGMQKRVAIARSWAMDPKLLLMDEPTSGLDNYNRRNLLPLIDNMRKLFKTSIIIVTHDLLIAKELGCSIMFLQNKKLTTPHPFDYWLTSEESIAQELFRDLQDRC